jgi:hypothetical protein
LTAEAREDGLSGTGGAVEEAVDEDIEGGAAVVVVVGADGMAAVGGFPSQRTYHM